MKVNTDEITSMPFDTDIERGVIGALLQSPNMMDEFASMLSPECFYDEVNSMVYKSIESLFRRSAKIDLLSVSAEIKKLGLTTSDGGAINSSVLMGIVNNATFGKITELVLFLCELRGRRQLISKSYEGIRDASTISTDFFSVMDRVDTNMQGIRDSLTSSVTEIKHVSDMANNVLKTMLEGSSDKLTGKTTGHKVLDRVTSGFQNGELTYVGARPGMGKTAWMLRRAFAVAMTGENVIIFSLEMKAEQLIKRLILSIAQVDNNNVKQGILSDPERTRLVEAKRLVESLPIHIFDDINCTVYDIKTKCRLVTKKTKKRIGLVGVDYVQLMTSHSKSAKQNRDTELSEISRGLKAVAKDIDCPVLALVQVSREVEKSADKRPSLRHIRESGSLEQDADVVMFLFRPSYYYDYSICDSEPSGIYNKEKHTEEVYNMMCEIEIAKFRDGKPKEVIFEYFKGEWFLFYYGSLKDNSFIDSLKKLNEFLYQNE